MNKISNIFNNSKAFIAYLTAGDPSLEKTKEFIITMANSGVDLVEIGIPFSDPVAEGEVIHEANMRALKNDISLENIFEMTASLENTIKIPLVFLTYINPVFKYGYEDFFKKCSTSNISGVIIPDLPIEEQDEVSSPAKKYGISIINIISPNSENRVEKLAENSSGFLYLVSSLWVTGVRDNIETDLSGIIEKIKSKTSTPVAVGFGIHTGEQAKKFSEIADGIIIGSALVRIIAKEGENSSPFIEKYVKNIKSSLTGTVSNL